jgi:hypothetical protein
MTSRHRASVCSGEEQSPHKTVQDARMHKAPWILAAALSLAVASGCSSKGDEDFYENASVAPQGFCVDALSVLMNIDRKAENSLHHDMQSFVKSKAAADPFSSHEFVRVGGAEDDPALTGKPMTISCKFKSADAMAAVVGMDISSKSCGAINTQTVNRAQQQLTTEGYTPTLAIIFDEDDNVSMGPRYLRPWPYQVAYEQDGRLHIRAKELYVAADSFMPLPARFKGNHYCHLIAPEYAMALLRGTVVAPALAQ